MFKKLIVFLVLTISIIACGGSSSDSAIIKIADPAQDSQFRAGEVIQYTVELENFTLAVPYNMRHGNMDMESENNVNMNESAHNHGDVENIDDGHDHSSHTNPGAKEGHYHIYLNDAEGSDPHSTAWTISGEYKLPDDIAVGNHSLRFELRDNDHHIVGPEAILFFEVVE